MMVWFLRSETLPELEERLEAVVPYFTVPFESSLTFHVMVTPEELMLEFVTPLSAGAVLSTLTLVIAVVFELRLPALSVALIVILYPLSVYDPLFDANVALQFVPLCVPVSQAIVVPPLVIPNRTVDTVESSSVTVAFKSTEPLTFDDEFGFCGTIVGAVVSVVEALHVRTSGPCDELPTRYAPLFPEVLNGPVPSNARYRRL